jgi:hypothetical protein
MAKELEPKEVELVHDAWARFERAVDVVAKSSPQHRTKADVGCKRKKKFPAKRRGKPVLPENHIRA